MVRQSYERLKIWQKAIELTDFVYEVTRKFPKEELFGLQSQSRRASVSVPSNIAEGSQRESEKDFAHFLIIAKGSLAELHTQLIIANRRKYLLPAQFDECCARIRELQKMLYSFHHSLIAKN